MIYIFILFTFKALNIQVGINTQATWLFLSRDFLVNWNFLLGKSRIGFNRRVWLAYPLSKNEWVLQETFHHNHNPEINIFNLTVWNINGIHLKEILHRPELFFHKSRGRFHGALIKTKNYHVRFIFFVCLQAIFFFMSETGNDFWNDLSIITWSYRPLPL